MKGIAKPRLFPFLCRQRFRRFEVEIVIQVKVLQLLPMDKKIENIVALPTNLQPNFNPIQFCALKKFSAFQAFE